MSLQIREFQEEIYCSYFLSATLITNFKFQIKNILYNKFNNQVISNFTRIKKCID